MKADIKHHNKIRLAATADLHFQESSVGSLQQTFSEISEKADVLIIAGDFTPHGHLEEAKKVSEELSHCRIPIVGVLGNHDHEAGRTEEIRNILTSRSVHLLEEGTFIFKEIGFAGVKGFGGGFAPHLLNPMGEGTLKQFVYETINEVLTLETFLSQLKTEKKVVVLHYSPIRQTVVGESEEIFPFLGSSRLEEPIDNFNVAVAFHGHAHFGSLEGKTLKGIPVYNVSMPLRKRLRRQPYTIVEI